MHALVSIASATLLIRIFGMGMQVVVTARFGLGGSMDAYFIAAAVPILLATALTYPMQASIVPVFVQARSEGRRAEASRLFSTMLNLAVVTAVVITILMLVFRHQIIWATAPGAGPVRQHLAADLAPIIFPSLVLTVALGVLEAVLNAEGQFGWPAYAGLVVPFATAIAVVLAGSSLGVKAIAVGTVIGLSLQSAAFVLRVRRARIEYRPILDWSNPALASVMRAMWPLLLASCIVPISPVIDQMFASGLSAGSISALSYALKLVGVPTGVVFVAVARATLPFLSRYAAVGDMTGLKATLRLYLWIVGLGTGFLVIPCLVLAHPVVQLLFQRGAFTAADTDRTAITFMGFVIGFVPMALGFLLAKAFSALRTNRVLLYTDVVTLVANAFFDYIFARIWQSFGIALATSAVYMCNLLILVFLLRRTIGTLGFLTPPPELLSFMRSVRSHRYLALLRP
jgi:putative peptidoglycan lipid II flippase